MPSLIIDTFLLTLFVVGTASKGYIEKHKRLHPYSSSDFSLLADNILRASAVIVLPNTLTDASNWAKMIGEPARSHIAATLQNFIGIFQERYVASNEAALDVGFSRFWLTDSAILRELANGHILLTNDDKLYAEALQRGFRAVNFNYLRSNTLM